MTIKALEEQFIALFGREDELVTKEARKYILSNPENKRKLINALDERKKDEELLRDSNEYMKVKIGEKGELVI